MAIRHVAAALGLMALAGCGASQQGRSTGLLGAAEMNEPEWCRVEVKNETGRPLMLRYYEWAVGSREVVVGEVAAGGSTMFSARCALGSIKVLGSRLEVGARTVVARTEVIQLDPERRVTGVLRAA